MGNRINADELLSEAAVRHGIRLEVLIAETGLWASPEVHRRLTIGSSSAYFPNCRRCRSGKGESRGQKVGTVILDDNSYANAAIKWAIGVPRKELIGFEACHIWPRTCYDERYHTAIANLVLLPRAIAGLTDHSPEVQIALQFRAFSLYGWHPPELPEPTKPSAYPSEWREPMPFSHAVERALARRTLKIKAVESEDSDGSEEPALIARRRHEAVVHGRDFTRYDIGFEGQVQRGLPKRIAMITFVKALVQAGVSPAEISAALPSMGNRLFRSTEGLLDSEQFVAAVARHQQQRGKSFDASRYFCDTGRLIHFGERTFALTNQWGEWTTDTIDALMRAFPDCAVAITPSR